MRVSVRVCGVVSLLSVVWLAGCSSSFAPPLSGPGTGVSLSGLRGSVHGGQQPITGAQIYVYAAGTGGWGGASQSLLTAYSTGSYPTTLNPANGQYYVTSDAKGSFVLDGEYSCIAGQQVYLYATGGDPGGGANSAIGLMAVLGQCPSTGTSPFAATTPFVTINEVSTVGAAYALAGFAVDATHVADDEGVVGNAFVAQAQAGMANAFANSGSLVKLASGAALATTPAGNGTVPQSRINTLANILAACVNSNSPSSSGCSSLFAAATADGTSTGSKATETATAAINIAHHAGTSANVALISNQLPNSPFYPALPTSPAPTDFAIDLTFTGGGLNDPQTIAIDGSGNVWVGNYYGSGIAKFAPSGRALSGSTGYLVGTGGYTYGPISVAIDANGYVWTANQGSGGTVSKLSNEGVIQIQSGSPFPVGPNRYVLAGIAIDGLGDVWITNALDTVLELSNSGGILSTGANGYGGGGLRDPAFIAIDGSGNAWIANDSPGGGVSEFSSSGAALSPATGGPNNTGGFGGAALQSPYGIAIDGSGNAWAAVLNSQQVLKLSQSGSAFAGGSFGPTIANPTVLGIDGSGNAWVSSYTKNLIEISPDGTGLNGANGYGSPPGAVGVAVDGSGNVWACANDGVVSELIGAATPVITPIAAGLPAIPTTDGSSSLGSRP